jgi:hypothetical protein
LTNTTGSIEGIYFGGSESINGTCIASEDHKSDDTITDKSRARIAKDGKNASTKATRCAEEEVRK